MKKQNGKMRKFVRQSLAGIALLGAGMAAGTAALAAAAGPVPDAITVGTLYASSGAFAAISMPVYNGLKLWVKDINAHGGVYVKPYDKKLPVKLVSYDDQSSTSTATTLYNQLITQDKVDLLVADSGSVLTSVAVPLAREHQRLLFDQTGTGTNFFSADNKYNVLLDDPVSSIWPHRLAQFLINEGPKHHIRRVAILYSTNDFTGAQAEAMHGYLEAAKGKIDVVYYLGVPTSTTNYQVLIHRIQATHPDAVLELGYPTNDIAFLKALHSTGFKFPVVFSIYAGLETDLLQKNAGDDALKNVFSYVPATGVKYKPSFGMDMDAFTAAYRKLYGADVNVGFNAVAGYNTGLVIEKTLNTTQSMDQLALRDAVFAQSGKLTTLNGSFELTPEGAQKGNLMPIGQLQAKGKSISMVSVYPADVAQAAPIFGSH
ncbi:amino acid ABC transporter substrate-binding protein [Bordetella sp. FB-8]|uniref:amino acid ABC transporter substrate-binding protein n=1 Tax=Bordetella sp. FB-8 TaxID=1159870 RepID=UPI00035C9A78|nr:amino acid ABC transporter substrate-binding protein [Bordetella sp. FB-8]